MTKGQKGFVLMVSIILMIGFYFVLNTNNKEIALGDQKTYLVGDVDNNNKVGTSDYILVRKYLIKQVKLSNDELERADVDGKNGITTADYIGIRKMILSGTKTYRTSYDKKNFNIQNAIEEAISKATNSDQFTYKVIDVGNSYDVINIDVVRDFGADPSGTNDSTSAFEQAITKAQTCTKLYDADFNYCSSVVYVPTGTYKLSRTLTLPYYVGLLGDAGNKSVLMIEHGSGSTDGTKAAIITHEMSSIRNMVFYYPEQGKNNKFVSYPPTIAYYLGSDGMTLENLYFVNSYVAIDLTSHAYDNTDKQNQNNSIFFIKNISGTPLKTGIINDGNLDTIKIENVKFGSEYWLNAKTKVNNTINVPDANKLKSVLMGDNAVGIELQRVDWTFAANINIKDYNTGILLSNSPRGRNGQPDSGNGGRHPLDTEGEMYDLNITNCKYPIYIDNSRHLVITKATLTSVGGTALTIADHGKKDTVKAPYDVNDIETDYSIYKSKISSNVNAVYHGGIGSITFTDTEISGAIKQQYSESILSYVGSKTTLTNVGINNCVYGSTLNEAYKLPEYSSDYGVSRKTKPKSTELKVVRGGGYADADITEEIKKYIEELKPTGGIIYIPNGSFSVGEQITVPSGIEIRGAVSWAHNSRKLHQKNGGIGGTAIEVNYNLCGKYTEDRKLKSDVFVLSEGSGISGIDIYYEKSYTGPDVNYNIIKGRGNNIYVTGVSLPSIVNGIQIYGNNHLIENIWGSFYRKGIEVSGENGIVRNVHIIANALYEADSSGKVTGADAKAADEFKKHQTIIVKSLSEKVGNNTVKYTSNNEILFHTFVHGPKVAYTFENANNFRTVGIGADAVLDTSINIKTSSGKFVNSMVVANNEKNNHYIVASDLTSNQSLEIINQINWRNNSDSAYVLGGKGDIHIYGGLIDHYGSPGISVSSTNLISAGIIFKRGDNLTKFELKTGVNAANLFGNVCKDGTCSGFISKANGVNINLGVCGQSSQAPTTPVTTPVPGQLTIPNDHWYTLGLGKTTIEHPKGMNYYIASTQICGLGGYDSIEYRTKVYEGTQTTQSSKITNGCATIKTQSGVNQELYYQLKKNGKYTNQITVRDIGKYMLYAQVFNHFLYINEGQLASNDKNNLQNWVEGSFKSRKVSVNILSIANTAVTNTRYNDTPDFFVKTAYNGILGRGVDDAGLATHSNKFPAKKAGQSDVDYIEIKKEIMLGIVSSLVNSQEAKAKYEAWGYN